MEDKKRVIPIQFKTSSEVKEKLKRLSQEDGRSMSNYLESLINEKWLDREKDNC